MYAVVCFFLLWTLFQLILCEARCTVSKPEPVVYILQTNDDLHIKNNQHFLQSLKRLHSNDLFQHGIDIISLKNCSTNLIENMEDTKNLEYVINLHVKDFYQNNYNNVKENKLMWAGDIGKFENKDVCKTKENVMEDKMETCIPHLERTSKRVKLVSEKIMEIPFLFNFVLDFKQKINKIVICTEEDINLDFITPLRFDDATNTIRYIQSKCNRNSGTIPSLVKDVIAIVAPNPEWIEETSKPIIFYEEPYAIPTASAFYANFIMRLRSWKPMTDTFLRFLRQMNWNRVAILSDDSDESEAFEKELRKLFEEKEVTYTVISGKYKEKTNKCCDFNEALTSLKIAEATIIIANVAENQATALAQDAYYTDMTSLQDIVWIARHWSEATAKQAAKIMNTVFSVFPKPTPIRTHLETIKSVIQFDKRFTDYDFYDEKKFADVIRQQLIWVNENDFYITKTERSGSHKIVVIYENGERTYNHPPLYLPMDRKEGECLLRSANYNKPCDDINFILYMLIILVFTLTVLCIVYFFQMPDTPYGRMTN